MNATNNTVLRSYVWGTDLSGTQTGAGGVGGLVMMNSVQKGTHFSAYDGNGNVSALVNASNGEVSANYEYGPFGEVIRATGPMVRVNPFRWSTQYTDDETDLVYYGGRYLKTATGGWLSRDPIDEPGFIMLVANEVIQQSSPAPSGNPYGFVGNDPVTYFDVLGFWRSGEHMSLTKIAWNNARLPSKLVGITSIYKTIEDANVAVDGGDSANDLRRHYNRELNGDIANAKQRYSEWLRIQQTSFDNLLERPGRTFCDLALRVIRQLSHYWGGHYAHTIGNNSPWRGDPGPIRGDSEHLSPNLKPCSWGWWYTPKGWGEHGRTEPAWREADGGADRAKKAADFVADKFRGQMPKWWNACHCYYGYN